MIFGYTCVPAGQVIPFRGDLDWAILGAVPRCCIPPTAP
jgi:hypothetical protein